MTRDAARILLVDEDFLALRSLRRALVGDGHAVAFEVGREQAHKRVVREHPDLVILRDDRDCPDVLAFCGRIRDAYEGPILMLSDRVAMDAELAALAAGADSFLARPFPEPLLLARVHALLRRTTPPDEPEALPHTRCVGPLTIDELTCRAELRGRPVDLTPGEFDVLWALARRDGRVATREALYEEIYRRPWEREDRALDLRIARLRAKLGEDARRPRLIHAIRGVGYRLTDPDAD